jgi:chromosome segregation ATPase
MLDDIRQSFDSLSNNVKSFISWAESVEKHETVLKDLDFKLKDRKEELEKKDIELTTRENKLKSDSLLIDSKLNELEEGKLKIQSIDNKLDELKKKEAIIAEKQANLDSREAKIKENEKEFEKLDEIRQELDHREMLLKKEMLMDKTRKDKMDKREEYLNSETNRLQSIASRLGEQLKPQ